MESTETPNSAPTFKQLEKARQGDTFDWDAVKQQVKYNEDGLIPAIAQQFDTKDVLMMAWMNEASLQETLKTGRVCYWSRSRQAYWRKGEESGQIQVLKNCVSIATAMPSCCWSIKPGPLATPDAKVVSIPPYTTAKRKS